VLDSGVDSDHPALSGKVVDQVSTAGEPVNIPGAHGTHVAGTIASNGAVFRGVAFQASLINIKVLTAAGFGRPQFVIDGLEQAVRRNADVANLSLGWSEIFHGWVCNDADCILCQAADNAVRLGVTVVVAAGNERARPPVRASPTSDTLAQPVASSPSERSTRRSNWRPSPASAVQWPAQPDVGHRADETRSRRPRRGHRVHGSRGGFLSLSGTSMASPHVAGFGRACPGTESRSASAVGQEAVGILLRGSAV
jgi:subtilisin family serine protease